jgi:hypothetical protein
MAIDILSPILSRLVILSGESICGTRRYSLHNVGWRGTFSPALGPQAGANLMPHFPTINGNVVGYLESQAHFASADLNYCDFDHLLNTAGGIANDHGFTVLSR